MTPWSWMRRKARGLRHVLRDGQLQRTPVKPLPSTELAICAIFKDEALFLAQWIEFHRLQGVERFYLYNNNSSDNWREVLQPYLEAEIVAVQEWPLHPAQANAYNHCMRWRKDEARWIAVIDIDEYLYALDQPLPELLKTVESAPALAVNWIMFSTSGHVLRPTGLLMENYTRCCVEGVELSKVIVRPREVVSFITPHDATYRAGAVAVNSDGTPVEGPLAPIALDRVRINHYYTKSVEDYMGARHRRGQADGHHRCSIDNLLDAEKNYNSGEDSQIQRFIEPVKAALKANLET